MILCDTLQINPQSLLRNGRRGERFSACGDMRKVDDTGIMYPVYRDAPANNLEWIRYGYDFVDSFETVMWLTDGIRVASWWRRWEA